MITLIVIVVLALLCILWLLAIRGRVGHPELNELKNWYYAHRGLHSEGIPENSMAAFAAAKNAGYGIELDVRLLADGNLAVLHDSALERVTGQTGILEELTTGDLPSYHLCGTKETIPEFDQVLELYRGEAPLIIELKSTKTNYKDLCQTVCAKLENYNGPYCLESFDPRCVLWLKKNKPNLVRGQLSENYFAKGRAKIPFILKWVMTDNLANWLTRPDFVAYRYSDRHCTFSNYLCLHRMCGVSWTIQNQAEFDKATKDGWIPIFEGFIPNQP